MGKEIRESGKLYDSLLEYCRSEAVPFHMPGHKRQADHPFFRDFPSPYAIDITEIDGFDNLHHAEGILRESMEWAASVYGADRTFYLVNGSTCGILSAISAAAGQGKEGRPASILMARNCHKAAYHGVFLNRLDVKYSYPQINGEFGLQGGLLPEDVSGMLKTYPEISAVFLVSPTYDGVVSDVEAIAKICHSYGIPLIVDEAHGAHFPFGKDCAFGNNQGCNRIFPVSALELGADLVIQSLHKTLPCLTQTALLHVREGLVDVERLSDYLQTYQTSSPSYVFMAAMERCISYMDSQGREEMEKFGNRLFKMRGRLKEMKRLRLFDEKGRDAIYDLDISKVVISSRGTGLSGEQLMERLRREYHLELEMCGVDYVTAITTVMDREEDLQKLTEAFLEIDGQLGLRDDWKTQGKILSWSMHPEAVCTIYEARNLPGMQVPIWESPGKISLEFVYAYPPGIPIVVPGERISREAANMILEYEKAGLSIQGLADRNGVLIRTAEG